MSSRLRPSGSCPLCEDRVGFGEHSSIRAGCALFHDCGVLPFVQQRVDFGEGVRLLRGVEHDIPFPVEFGPQIWGESVSQSVSWLGQRHS